MFMLFAVSPAVSAAVTNQSIAVPMYEYPTVGTFWDDITGAGSSALPFVIVNPGSGPGASVDPNYTAEIAENDADGIKSIGYVYTAYQTRNYQDVLDDINDWYQMYPNIDGIFIDNVTIGGANELCYMASLYNHVKNEHPNDLVVLNPGTNISPAYEPYGDIFMNAENTLAAYQSGWTVQYPGFEDNPAYQNRFWHAIHTTDASDFNTALTLTRNNNAGWVYITDDVMPNPYSATPSYWNTEISSVGSLPASTIPNRGKTQLPSGCQDLTATTTNTTATSEKQVTTTSAIHVANTSSTYDVEPTTAIAFSLPAGVTFSGAGTNWSCNGSNVCSYDETIDAGQSAEVLSASFVASCDYSSGQVNGELTNFAGNAFDFAVTPTRPSDCTLAAGSQGGDGTLADTGQTTMISALVALTLITVAIRVYCSKTRIQYQHATISRKR